MFGWIFLYQTLYQLNQTSQHTQNILNSISTSPDCLTHSTTTQKHPKHFQKHSIYLPNISNTPTTHSTQFLHCQTLQNIFLTLANCSNTFKTLTKHYNTLQHSNPHSKTLQHTSTHSKHFRTHCYTPKTSQKASQNTSKHSQHSHASST
jgi:hypothetical protein